MFAIFSVFSTFKVPGEKSEEVIHIYQNRSRKVNQAPGFVDFFLLQNEKHPDELTVQLLFEKKEDYLSWVRSNQFKEIHELEKKYPDQELANVIPTVTKYKVVSR